MDIKFAIDHITKLMLELETLKKENNLVVAKNSYLEAMNISLHKQVDELKTRALSYEIEQKLSESTSTKNTAKLEAENIVLQTKLYDMTKDRDFIESLRSNLQQKYREEKHEARFFSTRHVPQKEQPVYIKHGHTLQYAIESVYLAFLEVYDDAVTADDASRIMLDYILNISKDYARKRYDTRKSEKRKETEAKKEVQDRDIKESLSKVLEDFIDVKEKEHDDMCKIILDLMLNSAKTNTKETPIISPYKPHESKIELEVRDHPEQK